MRTIGVTLAFAYLLLICNGCVSPAYWADRRSDAADILTFTVGIGAGAKARVGPIVPGLVINRDLAGLRAGTFFAGNDNPMAWDVAAPFPVALHSWDDRVSFGHDIFTLESFRQQTECPSKSIVVLRNKEVLVTNPFPFVAAGKHASDYTQIEVVVGLGGSIRLGFNVGELIDFLLGWSMIDIFGDDLCGRNEGSCTR